MCVCLGQSEVDISAPSLRLFLPKFWQIPGMNLEDFLRHLLNSGICQNFTRHTAPVKTALLRNVHFALPQTNTCKVSSYKLF